MELVRVPRLLSKILSLNAKYGVPFNTLQLKTFLAIADTLVPALTADELATLQRNLEDSGVTPRPLAATTEAFASEEPSKCRAFVESMLTTVPNNAPLQKQRELKLFIWLLNWRIGGLILTGSFTIFHELPREQREKVLLRWKHSSLEIIRRCFDAVHSLVVSMYLRTSTLAQEAIQFPGGEAAAREITSGGGHDFKFETSLENLPSFDAVIIGSGSGGGVMAKTLAEAGMRILVVEKGEHIPGQVPLGMDESMTRRYQSCGVECTADGSFCVLAASTFGGGTTINWAASLHTPPKLLKEWSEGHGLPLFASPQFQESLERVCAFMGVTLPGTHNHANKALLEGARKLQQSYTAIPVPQNTGGSPTHPCNHMCGSGCRSGQKKGTVNSWLAAAARNSAHFMHSALCTRIALTSYNTVTGVFLRLFNSTSEVFLPCPRVIVSGGTLNTPALLLRSGIRNAHLGRNLHVHPTALVHALFPSVSVAPWRGNILTAAVVPPADPPLLHLEAMCMQPPLSSTTLPWRSGADFKSQLLAYHSMPTFIALARDLDAGSITLDAAGRPCINYSISERDAATVLEGITVLADVLLAAGAGRIVTNTRGIPDLCIDRGDSVDDWKRLLQGKRARDMVLGSAHQMGSARMGRSRKEGVVDPQGKVWGCEGLWIADGSVLPGATGVNPMVTIMATSAVIADGIVEGWRGGDV